MKISRREVESGPIRWLIRISGWFSLAVGLSQFVIPVNSPFSYYSYIENPLLIGIVLIVLDLLLPDPVRNARKQRKKLAKLYAAVYEALPSNEAAFLVSKKISGYSNPDIQVRTYSSAAKAIFRAAPCKESLRYIHTLNPQASYEICIELVEAAKKSKA